MKETKTYKLFIFICYNHPMLTRRNFIKKSAITSGLTTFYLTNPLSVSANKTINTPIKWDKAVCRFCSIGCGILVGTQKINNNKKIVSIKGDNSSHINRGQLCPKAYHNGSVLYSKDRLITPLLRMKNNQYDKDGTLTPISWEKAFDIMEQKAKYGLNKSGVDGVGVFTSGSANIDEGYVISKMFKAGFRSNNIANSSNFSHTIASDALVTTHGLNSPSGSFDDIELTDTFVSWGVNLSETYPILFSRIQNTKLKKKDRYNIINITTIKNETSKKSDIEIFIKPNRDILLLNYIAREFIYNNSKDIDWYFIKRHTIFAHLGDKNKNRQDDRYDQWEISFFEYKKSLEKYTLNYVSKLLKADENEDINSFQIKLKQLSTFYIKKNKRILSYWSSGINKQKYGFETNLALNSLHLLLNKHSHKGSGAFPLSGQASSSGTTIEAGTLANRLPANMYIKYKEHRDIAETIWNIPDGTLNSIASNNPNQLFKNIYAGVTKFIWITSSNPYQSTPKSLKYIKNLKKTKDLFVVTSDCYGSISASISDLILPTATHLEKYGAFGSSEKRTQLFKQQVLPAGKSMSDIWQWIEFSKRFTIDDLWGNSKLQNNQVLVDVKNASLKLGYEKRTSMFHILFSNTKAWEYSLTKVYNKEILNTETFGDKRKIIGSDGEIFNGYKFFVQKYLFEEYRLFGKGHGFDLASFDTYSKGVGLRWPYIYDKSIRYLFNPLDDIYASKAAKIKDQYIFYGKMGGKNLPYGDTNKITDEKTKPLKYRAKIFSIPYKEITTIKDKNYDTLLISVKLLEQFNTGTLTMRVDELKNKTDQSYGYINSKTAKAKNLQNEDLCFIKSKVGKIKVRIKIDNRFEVATNTIAIALFDERVFINKITKEINNTFINIEKIEEIKEIIKKV